MTEASGLRRVLERIAPAIRAENARGTFSPSSFATPLSVAAYALESGFAICVTATSNEAEVLRDSVAALLGDDEVDVLGTGFCHRPVSRSGPPLLTGLTSQQTGVRLHGGIWVSAGHGPWGISMSLGTGLVLAELILRYSPSADVSQLGLHA